MKLYWKSITQSLLAGIVGLVTAGSAWPTFRLIVRILHSPPRIPRSRLPVMSFSMLIQVVAGVLIVGGILATVVILRRRKA